MKTEKFVWLALRVMLGFIFLWAFIDKVFGLGFATKPEVAWIRGGSPTTGFLSHAVKGPFMGFFNSLAGNPLIDWLFMLGLLFVGLTLILNRYVALGSLVGMVMLFLMWLALLWPENNPIVDDHIVYIFVLALLAMHRGGGKFNWKH